MNEKLSHNERYHVCFCSGDFLYSSENFLQNRYESRRSQNWFDFFCFSSSFAFRRHIMSGAETASLLLASVVYTTNLSTANSLSARKKTKKKLINYEIFVLAYK